MFLKLGFCCFNLSLLKLWNCLQIVNNPLSIPEGINPQLKDLLQGLLCKGSSIFTLDQPLNFRESGFSAIFFLFIFVMFLLQIRNSGLSCKLLQCILGLLKKGPYLSICVGASAGNFGQVELPLQKGYQCDWK